MKKSLYTVKFTLLNAAQGHGKSYANQIIQGAILAETQEIAVREGRKVVEESVQNTGAKVEIKLLSASKVKNDFFIVAQAEKPKSN